jgi:hypothetical protein
MTAHRPKHHAPNDRETDALRLNDLAREHGLTFKRVRSTYQFEDYTAHGLKQALGFAEGYDRAMKQKHRKAE